MSPVIWILLVQAIMGSTVDQGKDLALTIYNDNFAVVKDRREIDFDPGYSFVSVDDVAATIQPETVALRIKSQANVVRVLEQNFENNLVTKTGVLNKYLNKDITVYAGLGEDRVTTLTGTLLAYTPDVILGNKQGIQILNSIMGMVLPVLPEGLLTVPTLVWKVHNPLNRTEYSDCEIAYKATGFSWKSDYSLVLNQEETLAELSGWVTIDNNSGKKYTNTRVKLIAGQVHTVPIYNRANMVMMLESSRVMEDQAAPIQEKTFSDYHMYTINSRVDLNQSSTKQISFIPTVSSVKISKYYRVSIYAGGIAEQNLQADKFIKFLNSKTNKLGFALPKGTIRSFKRDMDDSSLEFLGQNSIDHSPKDQDVKLKIGKAFDLVVKKVIKGRSSSYGGKWEAQVQLHIANHKSTTAQVVVQINSSYNDRLQISWPNQQKLMKESVSRYNVTISVPTGQKKTLTWTQSYRGYY